MKDIIRVLLRVAFFSTQTCGQPAPGAARPLRRQAGPHWRGGLGHRFQHEQSTKRLLSFFVGFLFLLRAGAQPATGIHVMAYSANAESLATSPATTQAAGSTILVWIGNGALSLLSGFPTDNKGNKYVSLGTHSYAPDWPSSGEALYVCTNAVGGSGHIFYWSNGAVVESTMMVVEVKNGGAIHDVEWNAATTASGSQTSLYATNNAPASIVAVWVGDAGATTSSATPNNGFTVLNAQTLASGYVEGVTASKDLSAAGANNVTWTCSPGQGAYMWMVAVQQESSTQGPAVTISSPANGAALTSPSLLVSGTATDSGRGNNGVSSVTVNGVSATGGTASGSGTANWSATITLTPGQNTITAVAYDTLNNAGQQQIAVTYTPPAAQGPAVTISSPANGAALTSPSLLVSGTATDSGRGNNGVSSVTVNGVSATGGTASGSGTANWSATITLTPGQNTITAVAYDTLNNAGQQQIAVTYTPPAAQGPAVTISSPANGAALTSPSLLVSGTATDSGRGNNGVSSVTVNGVSATGGTASGSGTANWSAKIPLTAGQNTITAVARDTLNNAGQQQIKVTYARRFRRASIVVVPPSVEITDPMLPGNGQFQFTFNSTLGTHYTVQGSTNLVDWDFVQELSGSGGPLTGIDSNATGKSPRFYRVMVGRP
jgi:hypothetical protein